MDKFKKVLNGLKNGLSTKESGMAQLKEMLELLNENEDEDKFDIAIANKCYLLNKILEYLVPYFEKENSKKECLETMEKACQIIFRDLFEKMAMVVIKNNPNNEELPRLWLIIQSYPDTSNNPSNVIYKNALGLIRKIDSVKTLMEILKRTCKEEDQLKMFSLLQDLHPSYGHWKILESGWFYNISEKLFYEISKQLFALYPLKEYSSIYIKIIQNSPACLLSKSALVHSVCEKLYKASKDVEDLVLILCTKINFLHYQDEVCVEIARDLIPIKLTFEKLTQLYENNVFLVTGSFDSILQRDYDISLEDALLESENLSFYEEIEDDLEGLREDPFTTLYLQYKAAKEENAQDKLLDSAKLGLNLDISKN